MPSLIPYALAHEAQLSTESSVCFGAPEQIDILSESSVLSVNEIATIGLIHEGLYLRGGEQNVSTLTSQLVQV